MPMTMRVTNRNDNLCLRLRYQRRDKQQSQKE